MGVLPLTCSSTADLAGAAYTCELETLLKEEESADLQIRLHAFKVHSARLAIQKPIMLDI